MNRDNNLPDLSKALTTGLSVCSSLMPIADAFFEKDFTKMWRYAYLTQTFLIIAFTLYLWFGKPKTKEEKPSEEEECVRLIPEKTLNFLREIDKSKGDLVKNLDGSISIGLRQKSRRDFDELSQYGLIGKAPSNAIGETIYRITPKGRRVLELAKNQGRENNNSRLAKKKRSQ